MKQVWMNACKRFVSLLLLIVIVPGVKAQDGLNKRPNVFLNSNSNGYLEYLPIGYSAAGNTQKYPLMVFLNGLNSNGSGSEADLENEFTGGGYPHERARAGTWPDAFTVNSQTFQFLIITPQFIQPLNLHIPSPEEVESVIQYSIDHYRIDTTRIYLVGASQGAGSVWDYAGYKSAFANRLAAIMPFAGVSFPYPERAHIIKYAKLPVWAFHNRFDESVPAWFTEQYIDEYNRPPAPAAQGKKTIFNASGHNVGYLPLTQQYTEGGLDVFQWLLQFQRTPTRAFAGEDQEVQLPVASLQLNATGSGPNGTTSGYTWQKVSGPDGGSLSNASIANPTISDLHAGTYIYRVTLKDNANATNPDEVAITVYPAMQRIEAESYSAIKPGWYDWQGNYHQSVDNSYTVDEGGGTTTNNIDSTDWLDYSITVPSAGNYRIKYRVGTVHSLAQLQVKDAGGNLLSTQDIWGTFSWDKHHNLYDTIPLQAGTQTIRIQNSGPASELWYMNYFEVSQAPVSALAPLPVNFTLFNARCDNGAVKLVWKTAGEKNSRNFTIEKSANGREWSVIGTLPSGGQTAGEQSYEFNDHTPGANSLYRIVQQDIDGRKTVTSTIRSNCGPVQKFGVFPNPVVDKAVVNIELDQKAKLVISIVDSKGAVVRQQVNQLPEGNNQVTINMSALPKGTYTLNAQWDNENRSVQLIKR